MKLIVTTTLRPTPAEEAAALEAAGRWGLPYAGRGGRAITRTLAAVGADAALVIAVSRVVLAAGGVEQAWSPGMGALRLHRLVSSRGKAAAEPTSHDPFLDAAGIERGDAILDCTLGLGADALVAAAAAGLSGRVVGLEASLPLAAWTGEGLARFPEEPARRIEVRHADHADFLASAADRSFDLVLFDPMFRHARAEPGGFDAVRRLGDPRPLTAESLKEARRVARRWVLVKDGAPGWDLTRLGLTPMPSARGAHRYYARVPAL